jgi:hypothetical protein
VLKHKAADNIAAHLPPQKQDPFPATQSNFLAAAAAQPAKKIASAGLKWILFCFVGRAISPKQYLPIGLPVSGKKIRRDLWRYPAPVLKIFRPCRKHEIFFPSTAF